MTQNCASFTIIRLFYVHTICKHVLIEKICMGYIFKSTEVRTLVCNRFSEYSSHTHQRILAHTHAHPRTPAHNRTHPCTPAHTRKHLCTPVNTQAHLHTPAHTRAHPCHSHTPHTYPLMPADALNLIIHMKLHVIGKNHM